jgi:hypothetical protein
MNAVLSFDLVDAAMADRRREAARIALESAAQKSVERTPSARLPLTVLFALSRRNARRAVTPAAS